MDNPNELIAILNSKLITWWINSEDTLLANVTACWHYKYNLEKILILVTNLFDYEIKCILN